MLTIDKNTITRLHRSIKFGYIADDITTHRNYSYLIRYRVISVDDHLVKEVLFSVLLVLTLFFECFNTD